MNLTLPTTLPAFEMKPLDGGMAALLTVADSLGIDAASSDEASVQAPKAASNCTLSLGRSLSGTFALPSEFASEFPTVDYANVKLTAVQCPLVDDAGNVLTLTLCPHVVKAAYNTLFEMHRAAETLEWLLFPNKRRETCYNHEDRSGQTLLASLYLPGLLDHLEDGKDHASFKIEDDAYPAMDALCHLLGAMRSGSYKKPAVWGVFADPGLSKDQNGYLTPLQIPGLPLGEIHAAEDASCCPARYELHRRHEEALESEAITAGNGYEKP